QRQHTWAPLSPQVLSPRKHRLVQRRSHLITEMKALCVRADREHEFDLRQCCEKFPVPERRACTPRRKIGAFLVLARETESHGDDGDAGFVIEFLRPDCHPIAQAVAGGIGERRTGYMHFRAWSMTPSH